MDMGSELDKQNVQVDRINDKVSSLLILFVHFDVLSGS